MLSLDICDFAQMAVSQDVEINNVSWSGHFFNSAANGLQMQVIVICSNTLCVSWICILEDSCHCEKETKL